ncbi:hypothetical protein BJY52DRAFT_1378897, partial [Lactarius psammicola]
RTSKLGTTFSLLSSGYLPGLTPCCEILFRLHVPHDNGIHKPSDIVLVKYLKEMLTLLVQSPTYVIVDALDKCPNTSGIQSTRARVLELVRDLLDLHLPNLRICTTSRPEIDIEAALGLLASHSVSLHDEIGQKNDIAGTKTDLHVALKPHARMP